MKILQAMRIMYILNGLHVIGGIERIVSDKMNYLAAHGYSVSCICCFQSASDVNAYALNEDVDQINLGLAFSPAISFRQNPVEFSFKWILWKRLLYKKICNIIQSVKPDIVIENQMSGFWFRGCRQIFEAHGPRRYAKDKIVFRAVGLLYKINEYRCDAIVSLTEDDMKSWYRTGIVRAIPNFTNVKRMRACDYKAKKVMACGRLVDQKGFDLLIDAWALVKKRFPEWSLDIYGEGPLQSDLNRQIEQNQLQDRIKICPVTDNIAIRYAEHSVFVLSSRFEGWGLVLLEAMTCGMACVAFDCPCGPSEMVDNKENGLLVAYRDLLREERVLNLSEAICYMICHDSERERMGEAAMVKVKQFDKESIMEKWTALFDSLVER